VATCPICKEEVSALDKVDTSDGFDCPAHGRFKVSSTVLATKGDATREEWEAALKRAKAKKPDDWAPLITSYDF
jgi:hypothetical protein